MKKEKLDHKCVICGKKYHSCDNCQQIKTYTPWRTVCDTFEHYSVYLTIRSYQGGIITKQEAKQELKNMKVTKQTYVNWPENVKTALNEILEEPSQIKESKDSIHQRISEDKHVANIPQKKDKE